LGVPPSSNAVPGEHYRFDGSGYKAPSMVAPYAPGEGHIVANSPRVTLFVH